MFGEIVNELGTNEYIDVEEESSSMKTSNISRKELDNYLTSPIIPRKCFVISKLS